jgi:uncharacterized protein (DUF2252 family)
MPMHPKTDHAADAVAAAAGAAATATAESGGPAPATAAGPATPDAAAGPPPEHLTGDDRVAIGRAQAEVVPVDQIGDPPPRKQRPSIVDVLLEEGKTRIPELLALRHGRMAVNPFATLRGSAAIMAADLASRDSTDLIVQLCGDAHLANFGFYASPERALVFDVNDFDETHPGPFEWDVLRLATSFVTCVRTQGDPDRAVTLARKVAASYQAAMHDLAEKSTVDVLYERTTSDDIEKLAKEADSSAPAKEAAEVLDKARRRTHERAISRLTEEVDGRRQFKSTPPVLVRPADATMRENMQAEYAAYIETLAPECQAVARRYAVVDFAMKVVGVGSVGTYCWVVLLEGRDTSDQIILQMKQATPSVLAAHVKNTGTLQTFAHEGERIVRGQKLMQAVSDLFLGWVDGLPGSNRQYYARQLHDMKGSFDVENASFATLEIYADICARTLARAHARSGDPVAIAAYLEKDNSFADAVEVFSVAEAHFVESDHTLLVEAIKAGDLEAVDMEDA